MKLKILFKPPLAFVVALRLLKLRTPARTWLIVLDSTTTKRRRMRRRKMKMKSEIHVAYERH